MRDEETPSMVLIALDNISMNGVNELVIEADELLSTKGR